MPAILSGMLFNVRPLCIGLNSVLLSLAGPRQNFNLAFALGTITKLLNHSDVLSIPRALLFIALVTSLASLSGVPVVCMPPFWGCLIWSPGNLHLLSKWAFKATYS